VKILKKNENLWFDEDRFELKVPEEMMGPVQPYINRMVTLGVRPEHIFDKLYSTGSTPDNTLTATVEGSRTSEVTKKILHLSSGKSSFVAVVDAHNQAQVNQDIDVVFDIDKTHVSTKKTKD